MLNHALHNIARFVKLPAPLTRPAATGSAKPYNATSVAHIAASSPDSVITHRVSRGWHSVTRSPRLLASPSLSLICWALITFNSVGLHAAETVQTTLNQAAFIPILGNTAASDLDLMKEINDKHIFDPEQQRVVPPISQDKATDSAPRSTQNVWDKIRSSRRLPLTVNAIVEKQMADYLENKVWIDKLLQRSAPYLQFIVSRLEARGLPLDLALLPAIESGYRPRATSPLNAAGLWQIVPITAGEIGLKQTRWLDGRTDLVHSTRGALDYLSYLNAEFHGDWELTLAAYNAGPGRVKKELRRNLNADIAGDFWSLRLPPETRAYVPKMTALLELIHMQPTTPLSLPDIIDEAALLQVDVGQRISVDMAARLAEMPDQALRELNAGLRHGATPPDGPHRLILPTQQLDIFKKNLAALTHDNLYSLPQTHTVVAGDSISSIAYKYGIKQKLLRELNDIKGSKILIGQKLSVLDSRTIPQTSQNHELSYTIQRGDTLSEIAEKFNVGIANITFKSGGLAVDKTLIPGQKLRIHVPPADEKG